MKPCHLHDTAVSGISLGLRVMVINPVVTEMGHRQVNFWIPCAKGDDKDFRVRPWKDVDKVFIPINIKHSTWILGELSLQTIKVRVFDSGLFMRSLKKLVSDGTIGRFQEDLVGLLDGIDYWASAGVGRKYPKQITFEYVKGLPQQSGKLGDCGVFLCMYLEQLVSRLEICELHAFLSVTLAVVFVGSAPLRGNRVGTMFTAVVVDGNRQPLLVAYGFGVRENVRTWTWFLTMLKDCMRDAREVAFISNVSNCMNSALHSVLPNSYHGYCCDNVSMILKSRCRPNATQVVLFWRAFKADYVLAFEHHYERLQNALPSQARWLDNIGRDKWARAYFPCIRFNVMVATIPDVISLLLFDEQNVPIETLIDAVRHTLQVCVNERSRGVIVRQLTPFAERVYRRRLSKAERCEIRQLDKSTFEVSDYDQNFILDYSTKDYSCGNWRKSGLQCRHVIATAHKMNIDVSHSMCDILYYADDFRSTYQFAVVNPLPPPAEWEMPDNLMVVLPPLAH
ncbi:hypothetical protein LXL04_016084 [Taraxacum kok-saghyz]